MEMGLAGTASDWFRRTVAIGVWVLLGALLFSDPDDLPVGIAASIVLAVATCSAISLLLLSEDCQVQQAQQTWIDRSFTCVSFMVPVIWALRFASSAELLAAPMLLLLAVFPQLVVATRLHWRGQKNERQPTAAPIAQAVAVDQPGAVLAFPQLLQPDADDEMADEELESPPPADLAQWWHRTTTKAGDLIEGGVRIDFEEGQREATVHISFCPPFSRVPEVMAEDPDGADLEIRIAATFKFGARITVRRPLNVNSRGKLFAVACRIDIVAEAISSPHVA